MNKNMLLAAVSRRARRGFAGDGCGSRRASLHQGAADGGRRVYDWSGFYIGINGGGGWSHNTWDLVGSGRAKARHDATGGTVGGQIGYRWQTGQWCSALKPRATGPISRATTSARVRPASRNRTKIDAFGLFTGQVGYAWNNVLLYVKGGAAVVGDKYDLSRPSPVRILGFDQQAPVGAARSARASSTVSRRTGRLASNTTTSSWIGQERHLRQVGGSSDRPASSRTSTWARPPELQVRRPGHREVLS